ncbi:PTRD1 hydrolase, partial [Aleadryas rufinucha]|nr:PTRD1 hydrolase [Aleadryas rufinucha]
RRRPDTGAYLELGAAMTTVVLEAPDENSLLELEKILREEGVEHRLWREDPEGIATCLALRPYPKDAVRKHLRNLRLLR